MEVTLIGILLMGAFPWWKWVTTSHSMPPCRPGLGPPKLVKLVSVVARHRPRSCTVPPAPRWVNKPPATTVRTAG